MRMPPGLATRSTLGLVAVLSCSAPASAHEAGDRGSRHYETAGTCDTCGARPFFHWDAEYTDRRGERAGEASIYRGTRENVYTCMQLHVGRSTVRASETYDAYGGRGFRTEPFAYRDGGVNVDVTRDVYFPAEGEDFGRWIDTFENHGEDVSLRVEYFCTYNGCHDGDFEEDCTVASSDGDLRTEARDRWFVWDDNEESGFGAVGIVTHVEGEGRIRPAGIRYDGWSFFIVYDLDLAAGDTQSLLTFMVQGDDAEDAATTAKYLTALGPEAMHGADGREFANFVPDGLPSVRVGGPYEVPEGGETRLDAVVDPTDCADVAVAWSFGTDGVFNDGESDQVTYSALGMDGDDFPTLEPIAVRVEELCPEGDVAIARGYIRITNEPPVIVSHPELRVRVGQKYVYQIVVEDPAPQATEPFGFSLLAKPPTMKLWPKISLIEWEPTEEDLVGTYEVLLHVNDDDRGNDEQPWTLTVVPNSVPAGLAALLPNRTDCLPAHAPILTAVNARDTDSDDVFPERTDVLEYQFEVSIDRDFGTQAERQISSVYADVPEGEDGVTHWQPPRPDLLRSDTDYFWRVRATDSYSWTEWEEASFQMCDAPIIEPPRHEDASCACRATSGGTPGHFLGLGFLGLGVSAFRRRNRRR